MKYRCDPIEKGGCGLLKNPDEFSYTTVPAGKGLKDRATYRLHKCKKCRARIMKEYRETHIDEISLTQKRYYFKTTKPKRQAKRSEK